MLWNLLTMSVFINYFGDFSLLLLLLALFLMVDTEFYLKCWAKFELDYMLFSGSNTFLSLYTLWNVDLEPIVARVALESILLWLTVLRFLVNF